MQGALSQELKWQGFGKQKLMLKDDAVPTLFMKPVEEQPARKRRAAYEKRERARVSNRPLATYNQLNMDLNVLHVHR